VAVEPSSNEGALPSRSAWATVGLVAGVVGTTAVLFGAVLYGLEPRLLPLAAGNASFGAVGIAVYAITNRAALGRTVRGRSTPLLVLEAVIVGGVLVGLALVNYLAAQSNQQWDLTRDGLFTLQPQSQDVAARLDREVIVYGFYRPSEPRRELLRETLRLYQQHTERLRLELVNPDTAPTELVERFEMSSKSPRIVVATDSRYAKATQASEEQLTNALIEILERPVRRVAFVAGHRERSSTEKSTEEGLGEAAAALRSEGYEVEVITLGDAIEPDLELLILAAPRTALLPQEVRALDHFLHDGGSLLVLMDPLSPQGSGPDSLGALLVERGIEVGTDLVIDDNPAARAVGFEADTPAVRSYAPHPITRPLGGTTSLFSRARSVRPVLGAVDVTTLLRTTEDSWAEHTPEAAPPFALDADDEPGPIPLAAASDQTTAGRRDGRAETSRVVVFGDADFVSNRFLPVAGNRDLFINACNWLLDEEDRVTIRPRKRAGDRLAITQAQHYGIMFFSVNLLPLLIVGFGFSVWALRRRQ
jgi:ABC-type uncharacterized transport system involved in gliding motility auxiliary subunit